MILHELVLRNVGTFKGRQAIDLTPPGAERPIVLVGGLNGAGKTTILESIQLVLYGPLVQNTGRRAGGYDSFLRRLIHRGVPADEGAAIELTFSAYQGGQERRYWIQRSWKSVGASIREILLVFLDGKFSQSLTSTWNEHVETFLPRGIAGLFFFDSEQIEALADLDRSQQVLRAALDALLGLDLVEQLSNDLSVLKRRRRSNGLPDDLRQRIDEAKQLETVSRQAHEDASLALASKRTRLEKCQRDLEKASENFRAAGGELFEQRETLEGTAAATRSDLGRTEDEIRQELGTVSPLLLVPDLLAQTSEQAAREVRAQREAVLVESLASRDSALLDLLASHHAEDSVLLAAREFLKDDRTQRRVAASTQKLLGVTDDSAFQGLISTSLPESRRRLAAAVARRDELRAELEQGERTLAAIPDSEVLAGIISQRGQARDAVLRAQAGVEIAEEQLAKAATDMDKAAAAHESALDKAALANLALDDDRRLVEHIDRVRSTLVALRTEATRRHLSIISDLVLQALRQLLRKEQLVTDVAIDPQSHTVRLTGPDGRTLATKDLSAGERQLLAIALLWGLARAAGQPLPVVIDTPLGRLDGSHRGHLLERYFPQASHQVVLLSTDTEIDAEAIGKLAPYVGRSYRLEFDSTQNATSVVEGYWW